MKIVTFTCDIQFDAIADENIRLQAHKVADLINDVLATSGINSSPCVLTPSVSNVVVESLED